MICPSCGAQNIEGADECATCGKPLYGIDLPDAPQGSQAPDYIKRPLSSLQKQPAVRVTAADPVSLVVRLMQVENAGCVLVMDGDKLSGIITGWDVLHKVAGARDDLTAVTCSQVMTANPLCLQADDSLAMALNLMATGGFRHVPVMEGDKLTAVVDVNDVFRDLVRNLV